MERFLVSSHGLNDKIALEKQTTHRDEVHVYDASERPSIVGLYFPRNIGAGYIMLFPVACQRTHTVSVLWRIGCNCCRFEHLGVTIHSPGNPVM